MAAAKKGTGFKKGDIVQLKSGGPKMTVTRVKETDYDGDSRVYCTWFKGASQESGNFDPETIVLVPEPAK